MKAKTWKVEVFISEQDSLTTARAVLDTGPGVKQVQGLGRSRRNPHDPDVPEIGDEVAVARALRELASALLDVAGEDIREVTHQPALLLR
jgi:hypothetical protein